VLDESTEWGARAARRLREEIIGWLTTVSPEGAPQPVPIWFLWDAPRGEQPVPPVSPPPQEQLAPLGAPDAAPAHVGRGDGRSILLYSRPGTRKLQNIAANRKVSLNLDSDRVDADIVICWGEVRISDDPPATEMPEYIAKYAGRIAALGWTPESFAADFSVPLRITLTRIHGW
jgi:PPOX class probable F420-dependent enzyme